LNFTLINILFSFLIDGAEDYEAQFAALDEDSGEDERHPEIRACQVDLARLSPTIEFASMVNATPAMETGSRLSK